MSHGSAPQQAAAAAALSSPLLVVQAYAEKANKRSNMHS
jgi:hypothetical protein